MHPDALEWLSREGQRSKMTYDEVLKAVKAATEIIARVGICDDFTIEIRTPKTRFLRALEARRQECIQGEDFRPGDIEDVYYAEWDEDDDGTPNCRLIVGDL